MATIAQTFYFGSVDDDQDFPGVTENVKKLVEAAPTANTATTVTWTTTTITEKTLLPLTANSANGDISNTNGWAINEAGADGMESVTGALRRIPAGVWAFSLQQALNTAALLDTHALTLTAKVYRVADINAGAGGGRTLLFSATSANQTGSATVAWNSAPQPEVLLQPGETIMVGLTATSASTTATVLGANKNTVMTVTLGANSFVSVPPSGIETIAKTVGTASGGSTAAGMLAATGATVGTTSGSSGADGALAATGATIGSASSSSTAEAMASAVAAAIGASSGSAAAAGEMAGIGATIGQADGASSAAGGGATVMPTVGSAAGASSAAAVLAGVGTMIGSASGIATASGSMGAVAETVGAASGTSSASGALAAVAPTVGTVNVSQGGEVVVIAPVFNVFA